MTIGEAVAGMTSEQRSAVVEIARTFYGWGLTKSYVNFDYFEECLGSLKTEDQADAVLTVRTHEEPIENVGTLYHVKIFPSSFAGKHSHHMLERIGDKVFECCIVRLKDFEPLDDDDLGWRIAVGCPEVGVMEFRVTVRDDLYVKSAWEGIETVTHEQWAIGNADDCTSLYFAIRLAQMWSRLRWSDKKEFV